MNDLPLYSVPQFAQLAKISDPAVRSKIRNGELEAHRVGTRYLITAEAATRFLTSWPSKNRGVTARWADYRRWKAAQLAGGAAA